MRLHRMLALVAGLLLMGVSASCGGYVSQAKYNRLASEATAAQQELQSLRSQLETLQSEQGVLQRDHSTLQDDYIALEAEHAILAREHAVLQEKLRLGRVQAQALNHYIAPALSGEFSRMTDAEQANLFVELGDIVRATEDPLLIDKYDALMASGLSDDRAAEFFLYLIESIPRTLE